MEPDTHIAPGGGAFPQTHWSAVRTVRDGDATGTDRAWGLIIAAYWKPVYKYIRIQWNKSNEDAKDLTQGFFERAMEREFFRSYDPARSRFRTFLRVCLNRYLSNDDQASSRQKRGGDAALLALNADEAEGELAHALASSARDPDTYFEDEWVRSLYTLALEDLRLRYAENGKKVRFELFRRYDLHDDSLIERPTYAGLAREFSLPATDVTNHLAAARREFRSIVLARLREICADEEEFRAEAAALLGPGAAPR